MKRMCVCRACIRKTGEPRNEDDKRMKKKGIETKRKIVVTKKK